MQRHLQQVVISTLVEVSNLLEYKVSLVAGNGTWLFKAGGATFSDTFEEVESEKARELLIELNAFLETSAGDFNIYPASIKI